MLSFVRSASRGPGARGLAAARIHGGSSAATQAASGVELVSGAAAASLH